MNGLETIVQRLEEETNRQVADVIAQAEAQGADIAQTYAQQAEILRETLAAQNQEAALLASTSLASQAQMDARKLILAAKQDLVSQVFDQAEQALGNLPQVQYVEVMAKRLAQAAPEGVGEVVFAPKDQGAVAQEIVDQANALIEGKLTVSTKSREMAGGFVLVGEKVEVDASVSTLVRLQRKDCAGGVAKKLFDQS